jgi:acetyl-CoA C-acetyltransferase/acetyl-CoA acyltransferase
MIRAVIVDAIRTPMGKGKPGGALSEVHPVDLLAQVLEALVTRNALDPALIDDVVVGCANQSGEQSGTVGRQAVLAAGFPLHVPSVTVERKCGSSQQAVDFAVQAVMSGAADIVVAAGIESMSRVPMGSNRGSADPHGPSVHERFPDLVPQGVSAELVAQKWNLSREQLDDYSARSHERAAHARRAGWFEREIVPVTTPQGVVTEDESIREGTTAERLAGLGAAFVTAELTARLPEISWKVTAGNSSQITDGAAALLIMSEERARVLGLTPIAAVVASAVVGDDPTLMLTGPIPATEKVLRRSGLAIEDIDAFEVNEAFASVPLAWQAEFAVAAALLNPLGGAIALGHPLGASGVRLMTTMIHHLARTGGRYGLQTMCEAGGMANATIIESLVGSSESQED